MLDAEAFPLVSFLTFHKHFPNIDYLGPGCSILYRLRQLTGAGSVQGDRAVFRVSCLTPGQQSRSRGSLVRDSDGHQH
jgi:hypothetical protein